MREGVPPPKKMLMTWWSGVLFAKEVSSVR